MFCLTFVWCLSVCNAKERRSFSFRVWDVKTKLKKRERTCEVRSRSRASVWNGLTFPRSIHLHRLLISMSNSQSYHSITFVRFTCVKIQIYHLPPTSHLQFHIYLQFRSSIILCWARAKLSTPTMPEHLIIITQHPTREDYFFYAKSHIISNIGMILDEML